MGLKIGRWMISSAKDIPSAFEMKETADTAAAEIEETESRNAICDIVRDIRGYAMEGETQICVVRSYLDQYKTDNDRLYELIARELIPLGYQVENVGAYRCQIRISWDRPLLPQAEPIEEVETIEHV